MALIRGEQISVFNDYDEYKLVWLNHKEVCLCSELARCA